jgi:hypothetical protein
MILLSLIILKGVLFSRSTYSVSTSYETQVEIRLQSLINLAIRLTRISVYKTSVNSGTQCIFCAEKHFFLWHYASFTRQAMGIRHPVPKARSVTLSPGAACFRLNSERATNLTIFSTISVLCPEWTISAGDLCSRIN